VVKLTEQSSLGEEVLAFPGVGFQGGVRGVGTGVVDGFQDLFQGSSFFGVDLGGLCLGLTEQFKNLGVI